MKLSQVFTQNTHTDETGQAGRAQLSARTVADINRQIRALIPGQTLQGEVVSASGNGEIQIKLAENLLINARVDAGIHLEQGKNITFEVRNNGKALTLSPLFTNMASDMPLLKALDMAGLPTNETTVSMTRQMMEAGLPVDRNTLQQVYREINSFPDSEILDIVQLHKLKMPVNEANVGQMASYRNLTHQLINGLTDVLEALPQAADNMLTQGNIQAAEGLYGKLFQMIQEGAPSETLAADTVAVKNNVLQESVGESGMNIPTEARAALTDSLLQTLDDLQLTPEENNLLREQIQRLGQGEMTNREFFDMAQKLLETAGRSEKEMETLQKLFAGKEFRTVVTEQLKNLWTLKPEEVSKPGEVERLYQRLDEQLKGLARTLETAGQQDSAAYKAVVNVTQNVDFLNQLNQMYTYVQLPLHLQQADAHGDLYVYTNKRSLADNDGTVSALLHLDMENLGPVDVYVTLQNSTKVNTQFYVADDEILDFLEEHMDLLTDRLQKRGYTCSFSMSTKGEDKGEQTGGLAPLLGQEKGILLSQYAFDVRT